MTVLSVNVNKVAGLRNSRGGTRPDVVEAAHTCIAAGAQGITVHPRPDRRHITPRDVRDLAAAIEVEYNLEGNPYSPASPGYPGFVELLEEIKPTQATLVPDGDDQLTSDHGWDLEREGDRLAPIIGQLKTAGCRVSLFMDPVPAQMTLARQVGADRVELYTEDYARAYGTTAQAQAYSRYRDSAAAAIDAGLEVNAGHDLNLDNLGTFLTIPGIVEVSIGHALISDALRYGLYETVRRYLAVMPAD
ncbi:MAG: pyridoxine 5'-phosphate synthase [Gammaproteobacteria bacterium]|nr:pyridoxine 5'-phosphate synthase [Gammaproteobacteria bacterium]